MEEDLKQLLKLKDEYIELLSDELGKNAGFLYVHGITCPEEIVNKGQNLRDKIKELEDKIFI